MDREAPEKTLNLLRSLVEREFPGSTIDFEPPFGIQNALGFGIEHNGSLTLVWTDISQDSWWLMVDGCVAPGLPNIDLPLGWVNEKNRGLLLGKYYCRINHEQRRAVIFREFNLPGPLIEMFVNEATERDSSYLNWVISCISALVQVSAQDGEELFRTHGGARFQATKEHLEFLYLMLGG